MPGDEVQNDDIFEVLRAVCESEDTVLKLHEFLVSSQVTKARSLASLAPGLIGAATTAIAAPEGTANSVWKGTVASLLQAARDEAEAQLNHQALLASQQINQQQSSAPAGRAGSKASRHRRTFIRAMKSLSARLGRAEFPSSLVPPQRLLEALYLNPSAYIDFDKYFNSSSSTFEASSLAEDLDGNPVLVRKLLPSTTDEEKSRAKPIKNFSAKWSRAFIIYSVAVLVVQEAESSSDKTLDQQGESEASDSSSESDDAGYISFLDMLAFHERILWYAAEYNWSVAACVDKSVRQAIDATCRSGTRSLAQCYKSFDLWSAKASEAVGLAMNGQTAPRSTLRQSQGNPNTFVTASSSTQAAHVGKFSRQGPKRPAAPSFGQGPPSELSLSIPSRPDNSHK
ncbi:hypothetical protein FOZ60_000303 [Perkinsus olseni]|uniref:Uncharacterized protein n=2 Tax=Perkinsus olseni TaxID=32597 RepID=A0A7J6P2L9_PEROL|nr:hypothetical protein FOZ60_000303 [Perkinsus olseni]